MNTMDFSFTDDQRAIVDYIQKICADFGDDYWLAKDTAAEFPHEFANAFAEAGWYGAIFPEEFGGAGMGITEAAIIMREVGDRSFAACSALHMNMFGTQPIVKFGSQEQKERFIPPIISGEDRACFGVTEPDAGTNTAAIKTFARRDGDNYVINGKKVWTSTAQVANKILLLARTTPLEQCAKPTDGMSLFYTDMSRECMDVRRIAKMGRSAVDSNEVFIEDLVVSKDDLIGEEGKGFRYLLSGLNSERILVAAGYLGAARYCLNKAAKYAVEREVFGHPIGKNQGIQLPLADLWCKMRAAELMLWNAAAMYDAGEQCGLECNALKYLVGELYFETAARAVRTHGGYGYAKEFHVERYFRECILPMVAPVSQELALCYIGERALGLPKSY